MIFYIQLLRSDFLECNLLKKKKIQRVLTIEEESKLVKYILVIYDKDLGLLSTTLKMKVFELTKIQSAPLKNKIIGDRRLR